MVFAVERTSAPLETESVVFASKVPLAARIAVAALLFSLRRPGASRAARAAAPWRRCRSRTCCAISTAARSREIVVNGDSLEFKLASGQTVAHGRAGELRDGNAAFVPDLAKKGVRIDVQAASEQSAYSYGALVLGLGFVGLLGFTHVSHHLGPHPGAREQGARGRRGNDRR